MNWSKVISHHFNFRSYNNLYTLLIHNYSRLNYVPKVALRQWWHNIHLWLPIVFALELLPWFLISLIFHCFSLTHCFSNSFTSFPSQRLIIFLLTSRWFSQFKLTRLCSPVWSQPITHLTIENSFTHSSYQFYYALLNHTLHASLAITHVIGCGFNIGQ